MSRTQPLTVVLVDDHIVVRSGLRVLLESEPSIEVVAEAGDVPTAVAAVAEHSPDVIVLDLHMPGEPSLPAIPRLRESSPHTRVVVLTAQRDPSFAGEALRLGASGYVPKEAAESQLLQAIEVAAEGGTYLEPQLGARLAANVAATGRAAAELSEREIEVLRLIARGLTNREMADAALPERANGREPPGAHPAQAGALAPLRPGRVRARARTGRGVRRAHLSRAQATGSSAVTRCPGAGSRCAGRRRAGPPARASRGARSPWSRARGRSPPRRRSPAPAARRFAARPRSSTREAPACRAALLRHS